MSKPQPNTDTPVPEVKSDYQIIRSSDDQMIDNPVPEVKSDDEDEEEEWVFRILEKSIKM